MKTKRETIQKENKVKNKTYFPLEANISNNVHVSELINTHGPKGFGIYIMILTELRQSADYRYNFKAAKTLAKKCGTTFKMLNEVISGFTLPTFRSKRDDANLIAIPRQGDGSIREKSGKTGRSRIERI